MAYLHCSEMGEILCQVFGVGLSSGDAGLGGFAQAVGVDRILGGRSLVVSHPPGDDAAV